MVGRRTIRLILALLIMAITGMPSAADAWTGVRTFQGTASVTIDDEPVIALKMDWKLTVRVTGAGSHVGSANTTATVIYEGISCTEVTLDIESTSIVHVDYFHPATGLLPQSNHDEDPDGPRSGSCKTSVSDSQASTMAGTPEAWWRSDHWSMISSIIWRDGNGNQHAYAIDPQQIGGYCTATSDAFLGIDGGCALAFIQTG